MHWRLPERDEPSQGWLLRRLWRRDAAEDRNSVPAVLIQRLVTDAADATRMAARTIVVT